LTLEKAARLEDPGAQFLDSLNRRWVRYGRAVLIALAVVIVGAAAAFFVLRARAASENEASGRLAEANVMFWQGMYDRSLAAAKQVSQQWPGSPSGIDAHRLAGDDLFWMGRFKEAAAEYQGYLGRQKSGVVADGVRRSLGYALESDHQYKPAAEAYESVIGRFDRESSAEFLFAAARCYRALNQPKEATTRLQRLIDEFGETSYAGRARIEMAELEASTH
jgi:tetratricopeptide (TPR) repeat protein